MDEQVRALMEPDETTPGVSTTGFGDEVIGAEWNSAPEDNLGADEQDAPGNGAADEMNRRDADQSFTLKHLGEIRHVGRDEVIALAQKGLDYDRIRSKYHEATATPLKRDETATDPDAVLVEQARTEKRQAEIGEFLAEYGTGIDPQAIPAEVWQSVAQGKSLLGAYQAWELKKLRAESQAISKNIENKTRSAGSRVTLGNQGPRDAIADDWYNNM